MNIYETISAVMADLSPVGKESKNQQQGFYYRGIDAVMNAMAPLFAKYKLFVVPEIISQQREERTTAKGNALIYSIITVKYTFYAEDGSNVSAVVVGEGMDSGDKSTNKAMSIAFKYACFQIFCIPTEETAPDPDKESHDVKADSKNKSGTDKSNTDKSNKSKTQGHGEWALDEVKKKLLWHEMVRTQTRMEEILSDFKLKSVDNFTEKSYNAVYDYLKHLPDAPNVKR